MSSISSIAQYSEPHPHLSAQDPAETFTKAIQNVPDLPPEIIDKIGNHVLVQSSEKHYTLVQSWISKGTTNRTIKTIDGYLRNPNNPDRIKSGQTFFSRTFLKQFYLGYIPEEFFKDSSNFLPRFYYFLKACTGQEVPRVYAAIDLTTLRLSEDSSVNLAFSNLEKRLNPLQTRNEIYANEPNHFDLIVHGFKGHMMTLLKNFPVHLAAYKGNLVELGNALSSYSDGPNPFNLNPISWALLGGHGEMICSLQVTLPKSLQNKSPFDKKLLHDCLETKDPPTLSFIQDLINAVFDLFERDDHGFTFLLSALSYKIPLPIIDALIDANASFESLDGDDNTLLDNAKEHYPEMVFLIEKYTSKKGINQKLKLE